MATISDDNHIHQTTIDFLRETMQATKDEIDYINKLNHLKLINTSVSTNEDLFRFPSIILDDFLYLGDLRNRRDVCLLRAWNIRNIISVIEYKVKEEISNEFNVMWINLQDCMSANIGQYFDQTNELIESSRSKNQKVFVHCQAGVSRSASIILAYLLRYTIRILFLSI